MKINRSIFLRNSATIIMLGHLVYFWFPFRSIVWKIAFVVVALLGLMASINKKKITKFDGVILVFFGIQLFYYIIGSFNYQSVMGSIAVCLLSFPLFSYLGREGVLTKNYIRFVLFAFIGLSIVCYFHYKTSYLVEHNYDVIGTKLNFAMFLFILPLLFAEKNTFVSVALFVICLVFNTLGAKRGNIIASIIPTVLFLLSIRKNKTWISRLLLFIIIGAAIILLKDVILSNEMLSSGYERILAGDSSGRNTLFSYFWNKWKNSNSIMSLLFGYGFGGTVQDFGLFAHNDWIELLVDNGLLGVLLYLYLFVVLIKQVKLCSCLQIKYLLISITIIWLFKSAYSMGFSEAEMSVMAIAYGYAMGYEYQINSQSKIILPST